MKIPTDPIKRTILAVCALILLCAVLRWSFPLLKVLIALAVAAAAWHFTGDEKDEAKETRTSFFSSERFRFGNGINETREENGVHIRRYVFSGASIDLTDSASLPEKIELQNAFSSISVRLPVDASITIHASGAFCAISLPGRQSVIFGENTVHCGSQDPNAPRLYIDLSCAFSAANLKMG